MVVLLTFHILMCASILSQEMFNQYYAIVRAVFKATLLMEMVIVTSILLLAYMWVFLYPVHRKYLKDCLATAIT